jgi:hypothetical protein
MKRIMTALMIALALPALAAVTGTETRVEYVADGIDLTYDFTFKATAPSQIEVYVAGVKLSSGYSVALASGSEGGTVTFTSAPADDAAVRIQRQSPRVQPYVFQPYSAFKAKDVERGLDLILMQTQEVDRRVADAESISSGIRSDLTAESIARAAADAAETNARIAADGALASINVAGAANPNMIAVTSTGGTSARTLAAHFSDTINALDYGVKCDGATLDHVNLQAAINAAAGKRLVIPYTGADCVIGAMLVVSHGMSIEGLGRQVKIRQTAAVPVLRVAPVDSGANDRIMMLKDLYFVNGTIGLEISGAPYLHRISQFDRLNFYGQTQKAIFINQTGLIGTVWNNIAVDGPTVPYGIHSIGYAVMNASTWTNTLIKGTTTEAWRIEDTSVGYQETAINLHNPDIEANDGKGLVIRGAQVNVYGGHWEQNGLVTGGADVDLDATTAQVQINFFGGYFVAPGAAQANRRFLFTAAGAYGIHARFYSTRFFGADYIDGNGQSAGSRVTFYSMANVPPVTNFTSGTASYGPDGPAATYYTGPGISPATVRGGASQTDDGNGTGVLLDTGRAFSSGSARIVKFTHNGAYKGGVDVNGNARFAEEAVTIGAPGSAGGSYVYATNILSKIATTEDLRLRGQQADAAGSVGVKLGNSTALTTTGARAAAIYSDGLTTEVASIRKDAATWGLRLRSPDGTYYLCTVANGGALSCAANP